jgi:hypothetical protein
VDDGVLFDDGTILVVYRDGTTASRFAGALLDPATGNVSRLPIRGFAGDGWQIGETHHLLELHQRENGELLTLRDLEADAVTAELLLDGADLWFQTNAAGRVFGLNVLSADHSDILSTSEVEVFELVIGAGGDLRYEPRRTLQVHTIDDDNMRLYGDSGVGLMSVGNDGPRLTLLDMDTGSMRLIDFPGSSTVTNRSLDYPAKNERAFALSRDGGVAAIPIDDGIRVFRVDEPALPVLEIGPERCVTGFVITDQDLLVVADAYGGLSAYDLASWTEVATATLSTKVRGAIFREATGLEQHVRDHLARNGAIVD